MEPPEHPLLNKMILGELFKMMEFNWKDFSNYRLVCKQWNAESKEIWRKNVWMNLSDENYEELLKVIDSGETQLCKYPFQKLSATDLEFHSNCESDTELLQIFEKVGPNLTHLHISDSTFYGADAFRHILFKSTPKLMKLGFYSTDFLLPDYPAMEATRLELGRLNRQFQVQKNLRKLTVSTRSKDYDDYYADENYIVEPNFPITWMEMLFYFPNIESFKGREFGPKGMDEVNEMLEATKVLRKEFGRNYLANLKVLELENVQEISSHVYKFPLRIVSSLRQLKFPLQKLSFDMSFDATVAAARKGFTELLRTHANSLETLCLSNYTEGSLYFNPFRFHFQLEKVTYLKLTGTTITDNPLFLRRLPNLKTLLINWDSTNTESCDEVLDLTLPIRFPHESLEEFGIGCSFLSAFTVKRLEKLLPNLKKLQLGLKNEAFTMVCRTMRNLESLTIEPSFVTPEGFLGVKGGERFCLPNITDLQHLKFFGIKEHPWKYSDANRLTNPCIRHGILLLEKLENVDVHLHPTVDDTTFHLLRTKFPNSCLHRHDD